MSDPDYQMPAGAPASGVALNAGPGARPTSNPQLWVMIVLSALMGFGSISTDLYLPALPTMANSLHANAGDVELTISGYLIGFSLGQLFWGPVGDRFGRRRPVAFGLVLFCIGSAGCALSPDVWSMIGWRIVQALGACSGVVLARAMVRDLYAQDRAAQMLSTLITVMAVAPLIGPLLGGQILLAASWRAIFWLLVGVGLVTLAALFTVPETLPPERRSQSSWTGMVTGYGVLLRDKRVIAYAVAGGVFYAGIYAYIAGTPFAYISYYHVPAQLYGLLFAASILGIMAANVANARLAQRLGSDRLLLVGASGAAVFGIASIVAATTGWGGLTGLAVPLFLYCAMSGLIVANSIAGALGLHPERAGAASAFVGAIHYGVGIFGSAMVSLLADGTPRALGLVVAVGGVSCLAAALILQQFGRNSERRSMAMRR